MACERIRRPRLLIAALVAVSVALWVPAAGHAAEREKLASAGPLARGSGYAAGGSDAVRTLQQRLRRLGDSPGPIDGLYGPLTEGAVRRFQQGHGLAVDGIVGRQTKRTLFPKRKSPAPSTGSESVGELPHASPVPSAVATRDGPASRDGIPPEVVALLAGLAALLLLVALRRQRDARINFGLTSAALLGVFGAGAVAGALFATRAAPHGSDGASAQSGVLMARGAQLRGVAIKRTSPPTRARPAHDQIAAAPANETSAPPATQAPAPTPAAPPAAAPVAPAPAPAAPVQRAKPSTYVVKPGDSLSHIARKKLAARSKASVVAGAQKLAELNLDNRIRSGDPDMLEAGEELRLP
jgi:peptidoglycan hydrolase-like protein with peptidoglycan-binding domain